MINYAAINKSKEWSYEKEWRYVLPFGSTNKPITLPVPKPTAVYLGAMISKPNKENILEIAK